ncbi:hypothetical protein BN1088_620003 [Sphingobacterium sp. PM2-P1-29]|nr:hypothetical protein BN1088_620003 [Sphingobacterium sp. PM2-P1-29]
MEYWNTMLFNSYRSLNITSVINSGRASELKTDLKRTHYWSGVYLIYNFFKLCFYE